MKFISGNILTAIISTLSGVILGAVIGYIISDNFYCISQDEFRKDLLDSTKIDLTHNMFKDNYPQLYDSLAYLADTSPWRKLSIGGIDRLYFNILRFKKSEDFVNFVNIVNKTKLSIDDFNNRINLRNNVILQNREIVKLHNPRSYSYFHRYVLPEIQKLHNYILNNYRDLTEI